MSIINQHNASEYLTLYMDGELDQSLIEEFESELASNSELQAEYRDMLAIREAIQGGVKKLVPPYESTATIFESLGLSYTSSISATSSISTSLWQQLMMPILASFSAALVTIGAFVGVDNFSTNTQNSVTNISNEKVTTSKASISQIEEKIQVEEIVESKNVESIVNQSQSTASSKSNSKATNNNFSKIIAPASSKIEIISDNKVIEPISENKTIEAKAVNKYEIIELNNADILSKLVSMFNIGMDSKFSYNYNKQTFEKFNSEFNRNSIVLSTSAFGLRAGYDRNIIGESPITKAIVGFSINAGTNLFNQASYFDKIYISGDIKLTNIQIANFANIVPIVGAGYDFNSQSPLYRLGGEIDLASFMSNFNFALRLEHNGLINSASNLTPNSNFTAYLLLKYNF